ncbi:MAG: lipopolysaccharide biosynthesis protein [Microbacterium sp.]|nr:lipopolysaccharide biosynthesis protein [Microbacterium sp.]
MTSSLAHSAARGAYFTLAAQGARILLQLLSIIVLARILSPHDYGLFAIVLVVVGLGEIFRDFGLTSASIQAPELSTGQRDNLFWINAAMGVVLSAAMFCASWAIGAITASPELVGISQWLAPTFLLNGLATQHRANLMRDLKLRPLAVIDVASSAIALAVAIVVALAGGGYWALVVQQLVTAFVLLVGVVIAGGWLPRLYSRAHSVAKMVNFGWTLVATNLINYASRQIDTVVVGFRFGTTALGLYNRSFQLVMTPLGQVRSPLQSVALPVLSRVQEDQPRFATYVTAAQLALGFGFGIPLAILSGIAEPAVDILLGSRWAEAAPFLRLFAIAGILTTVPFVGYWVYLARGLGAELLKYTIVTAILKIVCVVVGSFFGVIGVAVALAVHPAIAWPLSLAWLSRVTPMPRRELYLGAGRIISLSLVSGVAAWGASQALAGVGMWGQAGAGLAAGLAVAAAALLVPVYRRDAKTLSDFVRLMLRREPKTS